MIVGNCDSDRIRLESTAQRNGFTFLGGLLVNDLLKTRPGCAAVGRKLEREGAGFGVVRRSVIESPDDEVGNLCLLYTSPSPRDVEESRMPSSG